LRKISQSKRELKKMLGMPKKYFVWFLRMYLMVLAFKVKILTPPKEDSWNAMNGWPTWQAEAAKICCG
jgi:hypothetical protein